MFCALLGERLQDHHWSAGMFCCCFASVMFHVSVNQYGSC